MVSKPKKRKKQTKRQIDPAALLRKKQRLSTRAVFKRIGFQWIRSDGIEFQFDGRTGEIDDILLFGNILVIAEYTTGKPDSSHLAKKRSSTRKFVVKAVNGSASTRRSMKYLLRQLQKARISQKSFRCSSSMRHYTVLTRRWNTPFHTTAF